MRLNQFIAHNTGLSRRAADNAIASGRVLVNGQAAVLGLSLQDTDVVALDNVAITPSVKSITIMLNKPTSYVCSRDGQGSKTIYELLPAEMHQLKSVGRLDKDSSGLLLLTNDGQLAHELTHPKFHKTKVYEIQLNRQLLANDKAKIEQGVMLEDGISRLEVRGARLEQAAAKTYNLQPITFYVTMHEGRNRQIRRTFESLGYSLPKLHRTQFGPFKLGDLKPGEFMKLAERQST